MSIVSLFIDDNPQNLQQVLAHVHGIHVRSPEIIPRLANHKQLRGKADPQLSRLMQYKNNEAKFLERKAFYGDNVEFLRNSDVKVYSEYDCETHIDRVIELINRTNQLNFTKIRLPEDLEAAKSQLVPFLRHAGTTAGLVRVVDRYGDYGFVGFYAMTEFNHTYTLRHFCFSCRTLNMYVEHFVYQQIGRPKLTVVGEVLSEVQGPQISVDWIKALPMSCYENIASNDVKPIEYIFARGGCDLSALLHYFNLNCKSITGEFNGIKNWQSLRSDHSSFLLASLRGLTADELSAAEALGYDAEDFKTAFPREGIAYKPSVCLISFWADADIPFYRHKLTGLELPYFVIGAGKENLIVDNEAIDRLGTNDIQRSRIETLRSDWEYVPGLSHQEMVARYKYFLHLIPSETRIFMTLANDLHPPFFSRLR